jgi:hypothetical protein
LDIGILPREQMNFVAMLAQQRHLIGDNIILATRLLIIVVDEQYAHTGSIVKRIGGCAA